MFCLVSDLFYVLSLKTLNLNMDLVKIDKDCDNIFYVIVKCCHGST